MAKKVKDPYALRDIFKEMEMELVASLRRNFINHKVEEQAPEGYLQGNGDGARGITAP